MVIQSFCERQSNSISWGFVVLVFAFSFSSSSTRLGNPSSALRCKKFSWNRCRTLFAIIYVAHVVYTRNGINYFWRSIPIFTWVNVCSSLTWPFIMTMTPNSEFISTINQRSVEAHILQEWSMVKNLSFVSCAAWNVFPINSLLPSWAWCVQFFPPKFEIWVKYSSVSAFHWPCMLF